MAKRSAELRKSMTPESLERANQLLEEHVQAMPLHELRKAQGLTQVQLAQKLSVKQASISKIERQTDLYVSTLRRFVAACGGELQIIAVFPSGAVSIDQFASEVEEPTTELCLGVTGVATPPQEEGPLPLQDRLAKATVLFIRLGELTSPGSK